MQNNDNPYSSPVATVADVVSGGELATRGARFAAAFIDGLILMAVLLPLMFVGGYIQFAMSGQQPGFGKQLLWGLVSIVVFVLVQGYPLKQTAQTWGKKAMKIKIVDLEGRQPEFTRLLALRYLTTYAIQLIPVVGGIYSLVDILFIFGADRRCIHDKIAGTRVVTAG